MTQLTHEKIALGIKSLEGIGPMSHWIDEWDYESTTVVAEALGCPTDEARAQWKDWNTKDLVQLISDHDGQPGLKQCKWRWIKG